MDVFVGVSGFFKIRELIEKWRENVKKMQVVQTGVFPCAGCEEIKGDHEIGWFDHVPFCTECRRKLLKEFLVI
jgi:hypothetical protein